MSAAPSLFQGRQHPRWWWDTLVDWIIAHPGKPYREALQENGGPLHIRASTLYAVTTSDLFKAQVAARKREISTSIDIGIHERTAKIAVLGLDLIHKVMENKRDQLPVETLLDATNSALDRLGYGAKAPAGGPSVQVNVQQNAPQGQVDPSAYREAQARLAEQQRALKELPPPASERIEDDVEGKPAFELPEGDVLDLLASEVGLGSGGDASE